MSGRPTSDLAAGAAGCDELGVHRWREPRLSHTKIAVQDAELEPLVADDGRAVRAPLRAHAPPGLELVGDLAEERSGMGHERIVLACRGIPVEAPGKKAETGPMMPDASEQLGRAARR